MWYWTGSYYSIQQLSNCDLVAPYCDIDLGQHWLIQWLVAWRHQAITSINVGLSLKVFCAIRPGAISQEAFMNLIRNMCLEITLLITTTSPRG